MTENKKPLIGFIGQGWIGKNYANNFEERGYETIRYSLEEPYIKNKEAIKECDIVFIAVPTPTTPEGFTADILKKAIKEVGIGKIAVIKSTVLPGTTVDIQKENPDIFVLHSPEFLTEASASYDAANPDRNIMGMPIDNDTYRKKAKQVLDTLPYAPYGLICNSTEAELIKYGGNCWFYFKVLYINMLHDLTQKFDAKWEIVRDAMSADHRIGRTHLDPVHKSGRGAGGHCFIKDFAAFRDIYSKMINDPKGIEILKSLEEKNKELLINSKKDLDLLEGVYGDLNMENEQK